MSRETAEAIWGPEAVALALPEVAPDEETAQLVLEIRERAFRAWALAQPLPRFCAIVRVVAGVVREETMKHAPR